MITWNNCLMLRVYILGGIMQNYQIVNTIACVVFFFMSRVNCSEPMDRYYNVLGLNPSGQHTDLDLGKAFYLKTSANISPEERKEVIEAYQALMDEPLRRHARKQVDALLVEEAEAREKAKKAEVQARVQAEFEEDQARDQVVLQVKARKERERFLTWSGCENEWNVLDLGASALTEKNINNAYKLKIFQAHPDKGGSVEAMHRVLDARKTLLKKLKSWNNTRAQQIQQRKIQETHDRDEASKKQEKMHAQAVSDFENAVSTGDVSKASSFLRFGLSPNGEANYRGIRSYKPLFLALKHKHMVKLLLDNGANPNIRVGLLGEPIINIAARSSDYDVVDQLIKHGAIVSGPEVQKLSKNSALMEAVKSGLPNRYSVVRRLIDAGADKNVESMDGTALDIAKSMDDTEMVKLLETYWPSGQHS